MGAHSMGAQTLGAQIFESPNLWGPISMDVPNPVNGSDVQLAIRLNIIAAPDLRNAWSAKLNEAVNRIQAALNRPPREIAAGESTTKRPWFCTWN